METQFATPTNGLQIWELDKNTQVTELRDEVRIKFGVTSLFATVTVQYLVDKHVAMWDVPPQQCSVNPQKHKIHESFLLRNKLAVQYPSIWKCVTGYPPAETTTSNTPTSKLLTA